MSQDNIYKCTIWGISLRKVSSPDEQNQEPHPSVFKTQTDPPSNDLFSDTKYHVYNPRAGGKYVINHRWMAKTPILEIKDSKTEIYREINEEEKVKISAYIAKENLQKNPPPDLDKLMKNRNWIEKLPPIPDEDSREQLLLEGLLYLAPERGDNIFLQDVDVNTRDHPTPFLYALSYCTKDTEFSSFLDELTKNQYIETKSSYGQFGAFTVTKKGRKKLKEIKEEATEKTNKTLKESEERLRWLCNKVANFLSWFLYILAVIILFSTIFISIRLNKLSFIVAIVLTMIIGIVSVFDIASWKTQRRIKKYFLNIFLKKEHLSKKSTNK